MKRLPFSEKTPEPVEQDRALAHAQLTIRRDWAGGVPGFEQWHNVEVDPQPLILYDLNGAELFYDFTLRRGDKVVGSARAAASRTLGSPVFAIEIGPRHWDPNRAQRKAREEARRQHRGSKVTGTALVCFSYPKVGVRVDLVTRNANHSVIYDASSLKEITRFGPDEPEGFTAWSFYQTIAEPRAHEKLERWDLAEREFEAVAKRTKNLRATAYTDREAAGLRASLMLESPYGFMQFYSSRVLKYGPRCGPHDCFTLYAQQTDVYCAVATGQMILDFHRWPFTQDQIATAMSTDATGTTNPNQVAGYESLTNNSFDATFDASADWSEAKSEIDANRPLKSGIPGHARACTGWKRQNIFWVMQSPKRWLQIHDPWPWNADICQGGAVVWEDWDAVDHTNFIYVRHA
jgi:hypothetical protein